MVKGNPIASTESLIGLDCDSGRVPSLKMLVTGAPALIVLSLSGNLLAHMDSTSLVTEDAAFYIFVEYFAWTPL